YLNWPVPASPPPLPEGPPSSDDELEVDGGGRRPLRRSRDAATYVNRKDIARAMAGAEDEDEDEEEDGRYPRRDGDATASTSSSQESAADEEFPPGIGVRDGEEDDEDEGVDEEEEEEEDVYVGPRGPGEAFPDAPLERALSAETVSRRRARGNRSGDKIAFSSALSLGRSALNLARSAAQCGPRPGRAPGLPAWRASERAGAPQLAPP
ncbi:hypothetical protein EG860_15975, partial [Enterococcus faecalis]